jgi:hypothetical protein
MIAQTSVDPSALRTAADRLRNLITDERKKVFDDLVKLPMLAGNIDAGIWLQDRCLDRRAGLRQHVLDLSDAFTKLADKLTDVGSKLSGQDADNGQNLAVTALNDWVNEIKNSDRPKPMFDRADYNSGDNAPNTDTGFTYSDNGKTGNDHGIDVNLGGNFSGTDFEQGFLSQVGHDDPTPGFQIGPNVTVSDSDPPLGS